MKTCTRLFFFTALLYSFTAEAQYCMLPGRTVYSANQPGITNFKLRNINRTSANVEVPLTSPSLVVTKDSTVLERGKTYPVSIAHTKDDVFFPTARNNIRVWLDYNQDKDFEDAGETILTKDFVTAGTYTDSFKVPATAKLGVTRLRATAKMSSDAGHTIPTPCDMPADPIDYHGEMEDYTVTIVAEGTSVNEVAVHANEVSIYPNPTSGEIIVALAAIEDAPLSIDLYSVTGKLISNMLPGQKQNTTEYIFNLNNYQLPEGVYFIKVTSGSTLSYGRVVKVN